MNFSESTLHQSAERLDGKYGGMSPEHAIGSSPNQEDYDSDPLFSITDTNKSSYSESFIFESESSSAMDDSGDEGDDDSLSDDSSPDDNPPTKTSVTTRDLCPGNAHPLECIWREALGREE